jgi:hypothetical protein
MCHDCNLEWKEIWRTSRWFIAKDSQDDEKIIRIKTITVKSNPIS